jgi:hypothetical protein
MSIDKTVAGLVQAVAGETVPDLLRRGLTLDGRIAFDDAIAALSAAERVLCDRLLDPDRAPSSSAAAISLAFRPRGRLYLLPREDFERHAAALTLLRHVDLDPSDLEAYHAQRQSTQQALEDARAEICADLDQHGFAPVCAELGAVAQHMAPLIYYVGDRCISNFYDIGKSGFALEMTLADALDHVARLGAQAEIEPLTAVYCLHLALASGSYTRLEELNSTQLSRPAMRDFLTGKHDFYQQSCDAPVQPGLDGESLREKAARLARMRDTIAAGRRFVRLITGPNLRKREAVLPLAPATVCDLKTPRTCKLPPDSQIRHYLNAEHFGQLLGTELIPQSQLGEFNSSLEYVLDRIVSEAVVHTHSDFGMTRSTRDYRRFAELLHGRQTAIACGWSQAEYFCHVVPSRSVRETLQAKSLVTTLNAISARMRYNTWHYAPSYFEAAAIPPERGWFTAPRMADIADDSDQHHTGHVHAVVRYSIRSPLPLRVGREVLPGFIDLRLMRQSGVPYQQADLVTAIAYTEALQFLYQCLMDHVLRHDVRFAFAFGDKGWFERTYQPRPPSAAAAVARPPSSADLQAAGL